MTAQQDFPPLTIDRRYCGPPTSGNGGYVAGRLASYLSTRAPVEVTLRRPPPLAVAMAIVRTRTGFSAMHDGALVAEVTLSTLPLDTPDPVSFAVARSAEASYAGLVEHPFPTCFGCGSERSSPEALALRPGRIQGRADTTAATWVPGHSFAVAGAIPPELVWAALDCPGGWTLDLVGRAAVLGRITAVIDALPEVGEHCVVVGQRVRLDGRKAQTTTALYDGDQRVLARAHATWLQIDSG